MSVANKYGRRILGVRPLQLILDQQPLHETSNLRVLGLEIHATGSAGPWVKSAKQQASETIHLIRRIAKKSGGANSNMARLLVRSILQPRLVYRAQFHHLTLAEWARLEAINHEAMRAITGLPRITPLKVLQQESQLNTIDELVHQRRCARNLKPSTFCSVAALARYMGQEVNHTPSETSTIAPWNKMQLTDNKPLGRLYSPVPRQANAQVSRLLRADNQDTATLVAYTDASVSGTTIHTALVCPSIPEACQTCSYFADPAPPAHLAELAAIRDGLAALIPFLIPDRCSQLIIRTDSTQAIHDIRRVYRSTSLSDSIHHLAASASVRIRVQWVPRAALPDLVKADLATHPQVTPHPLPHFPEDAQGQMLREKESLRRTTRALIPPCGSDLPGGLTRREEVTLRRLRVGVALTPSVTTLWAQKYRGPYGTSCPFCDAPIRDVTVTHLLWTCTGLQLSRRRHLRATGLRPGRPPDLDRWISGPHHRSLLDFIHEANLYVYF